MAIAVRRRKPRKITKKELAAALNGDSDRLMHLDLVGTAEAALEILHVERARIGKWRRIGILLPQGEYPGFKVIEETRAGSRIAFPEPIWMATTSAEGEDGSPDYSKLAATPLWWAEDIRELAKLLKRVGARD